MKLDRVPSTCRGGIYPLLLFISLNLLLTIETIWVAVPI